MKDQSWLFRDPGKSGQDLGVSSFKVGASTDGLVMVMERKGIRWNLVFNKRIEEIRRICWDLGRDRRLPSLRHNEIRKERYKRYEIGIRLNKDYKWRLRLCFLLYSKFLDLLLGQIFSFFVIYDGEWKLNLGLTICLIFYGIFNGMYWINILELHYYLFDWILIRFYMVSLSHDRISRDTFGICI